MKTQLHFITKIKLTLIIESGCLVDILSDHPDLLDVTLLDSDTTDEQDHDRIHAAILKARYNPALKPVHKSVATTHNQC